VVDIDELPMSTPFDNADHPTPRAIRIKDDWRSEAPEAL
jgi:hypothetical protein